MDIQDKILGQTLVIGARRGLGAYLCERFNAICAERGTDLEALDRQDTIIYCAADASPITPFGKIYQSLESNILTLNQALSIPHKNFIYLSSVDVYPKNGSFHYEDEVIELESLTGGYASFKLMGEALVMGKATSALILRPASLFGRNMRPNNIIRMIGGTDNITLNEQATFNCITYEMLEGLIRNSLLKNITGIINCAASDDVSFVEVADSVKFSGAYGKHSYAAPRVCNKKAITLNPDFAKSSKDILQGFIKKYYVGKDNVK